jgi:hypothetical protein
MADLQSAASAPQGPVGAAVSESALPRLLAGCSTPPELPPDLARVVEAWPQLPEHIKAAVLALVQTVG